MLSLGRRDSGPMERSLFRQADETFRFIPTFLLSQELESMLRISIRIGLASSSQRIVLKLRVEISLIESVFV